MFETTRCVVLLCFVIPCQNYIQNTTSQPCSTLAGKDWTATLIKTFCVKFSATALETNHCAARSSWPVASTHGFGDVESGVKRVPGPIWSNYPQQKSVTSTGRWYLKKKNWSLRHECHPLFHFQSATCSPPCPFCCLRKLMEVFTRAKTLKLHHCKDSRNSLLVAADACWKAPIW